MFLKVTAQILKCHNFCPSGSLEVKVKVIQSCLTLCDCMDYTVHGILQARILKWVAFPFSRGSSQPRGQSRVSHIAGRFSTSWATGKPKYTGVGSLSLLQWIFLTQVFNRGFLHCRWILYPLSYQESPKSGSLENILKKSTKFAMNLKLP